MFDTIGAFGKQFTPADGGYLYYPSRKAGGKLVTHGEYTDLMAGWQRVVGRKGQWQFVGVIFAIIVVWELISNWLQFPDWTQQTMIIACVGLLIARLFRASYAPRRLVGGRPDIAPPRARADVGRQARSALNWPFVLFALVISGLIFFGGLGASVRPFSWWAWTIGSGAMLVGYIWIAVRKLIDR